METETGMQSFITALTGNDGITAANVWGAITPAAGFAAALVLIKVGYRFVKGLINNSTAPGKKKVVNG